MKISILFLVIILTSIVQHPLVALTEKDTLQIEDIKLWRTHSVSISDDGAWYTVLYSLADEPKSKMDSIEKMTEQRFDTYYDEDNQTDVLYISHSSEGIKYRITDGSNPAFSAKSDWVAYAIQPESEEDAEDGDQQDSSLIELRHLETGFTVTYESEADYQFLEDKNFFITTDETSLLIYDLDNRRQHYIGNIGEYLVDRKSDYIAYTISTEDKRGNGIYLYHPATMTTRALQTGSYSYSNLSWNAEKDEIAVYRYNKGEEEGGYSDLHIVVLSANDSAPETVEYPAADMVGLPEEMSIAVRFENYRNELSWSNDGERLFVKIKENEEDDEEVEEGQEDKSTVQVWHWNDQKLLSERITEEERNKNDVYDAIFFRRTNTLVQLTNEEIQDLYMSEGTDNWAIGTDNREYISDWDVEKNDLYRINLETGESEIFEKEYSAGIVMSPDGTNTILWDGEHFWCYDFEQNTKRNISEGLDVSFVYKDFDRYGFVPSYGFVGWTKDRNAVIVNHEFDLWLLPLDGSTEAQNLTAAIPVSDSIRFRFEDYSFMYEPEVEDRYIDLSEPNILYAFNTRTKHAGYYQLHGDQLTELVYGPVSFSSQWQRYSLIRSENSDMIIYKQGDYQNYPEAYLSNLDFVDPQKITTTNPQQESFKWGRRILIDYTNDDGVPLQGVLSIPEDYVEGEKLPMIVYSYEKLSQRLYTHPGTYLSGASLPEMLYVSDGYLFLQPDIHFNVGTPHSDMHECIDAAIEKVIELGYVDEDRIGYEGFSFGGHCGMYISTQDNRFAAIAAGAGVSNLVQGFNIDIVWDGSNEQDYYMVGQGRLATDPTSDIDMYVSESAVFNANTMNTPLLLFHGTDDKVVQWEHSFGFYSILRFLKKPVIFLSYREEGHGMRQEANRLDIQVRLKEFFDHYLKGKESKEWMEEDQPFVIDKSEDKRTLPKWK